MTDEVFSAMSGQQLRLAHYAEAFGERGEPVADIDAMLRMREDQLILQGLVVGPERSGVLVCGVIRLQAFPCVGQQGLLNGAVDAGMDDVSSTLLPPVCPP